MAKISAVIITLNEEKNIERCLSSLQEVADEILVLDSFSDDDTEAICKKYNVVFQQHKFDGHIQQKNRAMEMAAYDYVLSLDADEALSDELRQSILQVKDHLQADAYSFNRLTNYLGKWIRHCGWYPDIKTRLWNRRKGRWGGVNPHDEVIMDKGTKTVHLKGDLLHYSYYSIEQHLRQIDYFTTIGAREAVKKGKKSNALKAHLKSKFKFIRDFIFKAGFLDGYYGWVISRLSAQATFIKYIKIRELQKENRD